MIRVLIVGSGQMGTIIRGMVEYSDTMEFIDTIDVSCPEKFDTAPTSDVVVDFSGPGSLDGICRYIRRTGAALVSGTTGYSADELATLLALADTSAIIHSSNYSLGIAVLKRVLSEITPVLKDNFDIELSETHHHRKVDSPSGTAKLLLNAINPDDEYDVIYGREGNCGARPKKEIGVHALRGGTVSGIHTVSFFGEDEILEFTHTATSRRIFACGAVDAVRAIAGRAPGRYTLDDLIFTD